MRGEGDTGENHPAAVNELENYQDRQRLSRKNTNLSSGDFKSYRGKVGGAYEIILKLQEARCSGLAGLTFGLRPLAYEEI